MKKTLLFFGAMFLSASAGAQEAPPPRKMPRVPVSREYLYSARDPMPASREKKGVAAVIDGEKLRIGETNVRLFGVVPPQLSASFGPQARGELDALAAGQNVSCQIRDRDRDGWLLATCANAAGNDLALELLKRGLAVAARGSIADTELASSYLAAEQAAQAQKTGLWLGSSAPPVSSSLVAPPKPEAAEAKKEDITAAKVDADAQAKIAADVLSEQSRLDEMGSEAGIERGFFERYQILISGFLAFLTALSVLAVLRRQRNEERREELKALAAALRGEVTSMRYVCVGRARSITDDMDDRTAAWPRLRATLYQAYVGRLGFLGSELARQISALYGQASDYAAYFNPSSGMAEAPKKQALEALVKHIDDILPRLAVIEKTGVLPVGSHVLAVRRPPPEAKANVSAMHVSARPAAAAPAPAPAVHVAPVPAPALRTSTPPPVAKALPVVKAAPSAKPSSPPFHFPTVSISVLRERAVCFLRSCREAMAKPPEPPPSMIDPQSAEYTALIEAEMMRYQYEEQIRTIEMQQRRRG